MNKDLFPWIEKWYANNCNGDWEHSYGITIETLDNPGWEIKIDLKNTSLENENIDYILTENSEEDWYGIKVENSQFIGTGDPYKLSFLIEKFRQFTEERTKR